MTDFLARTLACSLPIIPAWDFTLKKWMGDGFLIWCSDVRLSVAICE